MTLVSVVAAGPARPELPAELHRHRVRHRGLRRGRAWPAGGPEEALRAP